ncbi:type IV secretion protein Rhs [Pantoea sp. Ap-967]|uniref:RHS repeat-associated core domain-containing protein n=1 Tax=Pantoea sp. Ap-967 TaxID=2608362 RepID=UPI001421E68F|nr:RHS repeat-associated core domain-containing protein [Pantoea sp. Ap-967]NIE75307.1 type IV secretion protein Rhs [Pantoea sp. Ap-967]
MSDALWAAREGDALLHTSIMADIVGGVLEVAANVAIGALATAAVAAALGITVATGGLGCFVLGAVVGLVVGVAMAKTGADTGLSRLCEGIGNFLFPPSVQATIATGSSDTHINGKRAARAAGIVLAPMAALPGVAEHDQGEAQEETFLDMAGSFFSQMWRPTVASPAPNTQEADDDKVLCTKHPAMPPQYLAEGSSKVLINGHPAARSGDRSTCEAVIVDGGLVSSNVRIGGPATVVREIRSGKTPGIGLAITALMLLRGRGGKFYSRFGCMLLGGATSFITGQVTHAIVQATSASPNPVHAPTGAKILYGPEELDFSLQALLPLDWQRFYNSRDERRDGLFGAGWSTEYEVFVEIRLDDDGNEQLLFTDEQARVIDMGHIARADAVFSVGEGLSVRRSQQGEVLIEDIDKGLYRLFQPEPGNPAHLRLSALGDRNDNRIYLDYDDSGRLARLRDTFDLVQVEIHRDVRWPTRVARIERRHQDGDQQLLASYQYDACGDLAAVFDGKGQLRRRFAYDSQRHLIEHENAAGLRCFYEWASTADARRVVRYWSNGGDEYRFDYDIEAGLTRVTDGLQRVSTRRWNTQYQVTEYTDAVGATWRFDWDDERQLLGAVDPLGGRWAYFYDASGNLTQALDPLGRSESTQWLEHWALPRSTLDPAGNRWRYHYDPRGNCIHESDPQGNVTRYRYDPHGQPVEIIDPMGHSRLLRWNDLGLLLQETDCSGNVTRYRYDRHGYLTSVTDAMGESTGFEYDHDGRLLAVVQPDGTREGYRYDAAGRLVQTIDPAGGVNQYCFDVSGALTHAVDPLGRTLGYQIDAYGRLLCLTNENGERFHFQWDAADRLVREQFLDGTGREYRHDLLHNIVQVAYTPAPNTDAVEPIVHRLERDAVGRLLTKHTSDGITTYTHDAIDQLTGIHFQDSDGNGESLAMAFDEMGQLVEEHSAEGVLRHQYDELGNLTRTQLFDGRWINRLYYGSGHLHQINLDGRVINDYERDRLHREVVRTQGALHTRSEYDRNGRLRSRKCGPANQPAQLPAPHQQRFEYDPRDYLSRRFRQVSGQALLDQVVQHDARGRLLGSHDLVRGGHETYHYDAVGNLLANEAQSQVQHDRLHTFQDKHYRYDAFGRLAEKRSGRRATQLFRYDAEHRLIEVRSQQAGRERRVRMRYDPLGRRVEKSEYDANEQLLGQTRFAWDGLRLLQEQRHGHVSLYLYEGEGYEPLARIDGTGPGQQVLHFHNDVSGLPERLTDEQGDMAWQASYLGWGHTLDESRAASCLQEQNLRFQGQYLDRETGLHYNTFRFYDPDIGRFTQPDPIGLAGGHQLYGYAPNPVNWVDPLGWLTLTGYTKSGTKRTTPEWRRRDGPAALRDHHMIPQEMWRDRDFRNQMKTAGIKNPKRYIDKQISRIPNAFHADLHSKGWNSDWEAWHQNNRNFTQKDLQKQIKVMMRKYNVPKATRNHVRRYGKNGKGCGG